MTVSNDNDLTETHLRINKENAPYVLTKPLHASQKLEKQLEDGMVVVSLKVHLNLEFERLILGFGDSIRVNKPRVLRERIKRKLKKAIELYDR